MAVNSAGGHYPCPPGAGNPDSYPNSPSLTPGFIRKRAGPCHFFTNNGRCGRLECPYDHQLSMELRRNQAQAYLQTVPQQQINSFQGPILQKQHAHQPCTSCCQLHPSQGPIEQSHSFGPRRTHPIPHMAQHPPHCEGLYSQESHQSSYFNHNYQGGNSQGSSYTNPNRYHENPNFRPGNCEHQGPVQGQNSFVGQQQFSGVPQQQYSNYTRAPSVDRGFRSIPTGPRGDPHRRNNRPPFKDRSFQNPTDNRNFTYWQSSTPHSALDASMAPRTVHESHDLIDLHHDSGIDSSGPRKTAIDLLEEDPPEVAKTMSIIPAAVPQESRSLINNGLYELMAPLAEMSLQKEEHSTLTTSYRNGLPKEVGQSNDMGNSLQGNETVNGLNRASDNLKVVLPYPAQDRGLALHDQSHDLATPPKARENTIGVSGPKSSTSHEDHYSTATARPHQTINSNVEEDLEPELIRRIRGIAPHLRAKALGELCLKYGLSEDALNPLTSPTTNSKLVPPLSGPAAAAVESPHIGNHSVDKPGESKLAVAVAEQATVDVNPVGSNPAVAITSILPISPQPKTPEAHSNLDDEYPSSVFSSPPSSPRLTTFLPQLSLYRPNPLPFPAELSFEEFKKKNICVSNISYVRLYPADTASPTGVDSWENRPVFNRAMSPAKEPQSSRAHSPKQRAPAVDDEFHGDGLLGPRPKPRWYESSGHSGPPSPDAHLTSDEPQPLARIVRQHVFDMAYCWNCWSTKHKSVDCPEPTRSMDERDQLRAQKRIISKSWIRVLEKVGRQPAIITIPGVSDEEALKLQSAVPLRNPRKKVPRNFSPAVSVYEESPGSPTDRPDWWNNTPPIPDISDAEVAVWANATDSSTGRHEGTYYEDPWSDTSMESGAETTISSESTEAHMDGACYNSLFNGNNSASEDESTTSLSANNLMRVTEGNRFTTLDSTSSSTDGNNSEVVDIGDNGERGRDGKESSNEKHNRRIREPRPEEIQEPRVIFVDSELFTAPRRRRRNASPNRFERALNGLSPRGRTKHSRKYTARVDRISRLPTEILHQIIEYVGLQRLHDDPQNEGTVYERSRAEGTRALDLRPLRFVCRKFYLVVQTIIYTRINITAVPDFERLARQLHLRDRLANMVLDVTVDIHQLRKNENWKDYGNFKAITRYRGGAHKMTLGTAHLIRDISSIFENCKFLSRFAFHCTGAVQAFCRLEGHYPSVRRVSICDQLEIGKSGDLFWASIQRFPNIEEISLLRSEENRDLDFRPIQINPTGKPWTQCKFDNLQYIKFTNAAEISDKLLLHILPNLPKLSRIYLYECKLITSSGIARVITQIQDRLTEFVYCDYVDCNGKTSPDEEKTRKSHHLCHALARCHNLRDLSLSAYRCCRDLFDMSNWPYLRNLKIDMMFYTGCNDEEEDTDFREALVRACSEGRFPSLSSSSVVFQTNTPGLIYRRNRKFTQEELERAGGYA